MSRVLRQIPIVFQQLRLTSGCSVRQSRDMDQSIPPPGNGPGAGTQEPLRIEVGPPREPTRIQTLLASAAFADLLKVLERLLARAGKNLDSLGREALHDRIMMACLAYDGSRLLSDAPPRSNLHELHKPLARVIELMMNEANIPRMLDALGYLGPCLPTKEEAERAVARIREIYGDEADDMMAALGYPGPSVYNKEVSDCAIVQLEITLNILHKLARAVRPAPKRGDAKKDLRFLVHTLADIWEWWSGKRFAYYPDKGVAANDATQFVYEVIHFVAPERMGQLEKVIERRVIPARGRKLHPNWYNTGDYNDSP
jgi:hypothetical protein